MGGASFYCRQKAGRTFNKKANAEFTAGSWGRQISLVEYGGVTGPYDYYAGYQYTTEKGWRDYSPNHLNQFFSKLGWENDTTRLEISYTAADNALIGNGLAPKYLLGSDNSGINTVPDYTGNTYHKINLAATHFYNDDTLLTSNIYWKRSDRNTWNGDAEIELDGDNLVTAGTATIDGTEVRLFRYSSDAIDEIEGENNVTNTKQDKYGLATQLSLTQPLAGFENNLTMGVNLETSLISFLQTGFEGATLLDNRQLVKGSGDGAVTTNLQGRTKTFGLYAVDTISFNDQWHFTGGARYNYQEIDNLDRREDQSDGSLPKFKVGDVSILL